MSLRALILIMIATGLASCAPEVKCDHKGFIQIPDGASYEDELRWRAENRELMARRMDATTNSDGDAQFYAKEGLEKAASCP